MLQWPSGLLIPEWRAPDFRVKWRVHIEFSANERGNFSHQRYRQLVRGYFRLNGKDRVHPIGGNRALHRTEWREDGFESSAYGDRSQQSANNSYSTDGSSYHATDAPGFTNLKQGDVAELALEFEGQVVDVASGTVVCHSFWQVEGTYFVR